MTNRAGFTLVEILVVLAILALLLPIFLLVTNQTVNLNNDARLRAGANLLAEGLIEELLADISLPPSGNRLPYSWQWQLQGEAGVPSGLEAIEVLVTWQYRGREQQVNLRTYRSATP